MAKHNLHGMASELCWLVMANAVLVSSIMHRLNVSGQF